MPSKSLPAKLTNTDMKRHLEMVEHVREAQQFQAAADELRAAANVWARDLAKQYDLGKNGQVLEDGTIQR